MKPIEVLDEINKYCDEIPEQFTQSNANDWFSSFSSYLSFDCELRTGASKAVIVLTNEPFVLKIPFTGYYLNEEGEYCDEDFGEPLEYCEHIQANKNDGWDYCSAETDIYEAAIQEGLEMYFASEMLLGFIENYPIYVQQKAVPYGDASCSEEIPNNSKKYRNIFYDCCTPERWVKKFIEVYGEEEMHRLNDFCDSYDLGDLSWSNVGFDETETYPILIDYSNYRD